MAGTVLPWEQEVWDELGFPYLGRCQVVQHPLPHTPTPLGHSREFAFIFFLNAMRSHWRWRMDDGWGQVRGPDDGPGWGCKWAEVSSILKVNPAKFTHGSDVNESGGLPGPEQPGGWWWIVDSGALFCLSSEFPISHPGRGEGVSRLCHVEIRSSVTGVMKSGGQLWLVESHGSRERSRAGQHS